MSNGGARAGSGSATVRILWWSPAEHLKRSSSSSCLVTSGAGAIFSPVQ
jgi:hypothetical protein